MVKVATISGYKPFEIGIFQPDHPAAEYIKTAIKKTIVPLIEDGLEWVMISGQLGVELWAGEAVFELQELYPDLKLAVFTPFLNQEESWKDTNKNWYESILNRADHVDSLTKKPYENSWQFRLKNQFFIEKSDVLVLLYDLEKEGSPKFIYETAKKFQQSNPYDIQLITLYDLQMVVEEEQLRQQGF
ncbi:MULTISPECIES: DUF1273 domain-containing protein [Mesobacillus]|uniref:UPF0398 protein UB32_09440 n=2 Tax=Mesobacillus TaxID=2675231 RepID=A0A0D6Z8S8_9BACI|nr:MULTISPECIES: DUF1273 domain-containing protein [Mesobacillus]KIY22214.1 hypothetical protein UB32_09440 [Mesobacillus subterraneus]MDQ0412059.1 putative phage-like protein YoqJ [Mesobacillus stamsii]